MSLRALILLLVLSTSAVAEMNPSIGSRSPDTVAVSNRVGAESSMASSATLPAVPLSEKKRPVALVLGIALVVITFHQALMRRQRA